MKNFIDNMLQFVRLERARRIRDKISKSIFTDWFEQEKMLADDLRLQAYAGAITKYITPGSTVLDLGTGTGVLAFVAARAGARKVYALEHAEIIEVARLVGRHNGFSNVEYIKMHSQKVFLADRVDFIVQEQMGSILDDENMIGNIVDLRDRLLKPGGRILPNKLQMYAEPIQLKPTSRIPFLWENEILGIDFSVARHISPTPSGNYLCRKIQPTDVDVFLSEPEPLFHFNLENVRVGEVPLKYDYKRRVIRTGTFDGICLYFVAAFDDEINIDTNPKAAIRPTHWSTFMFRVPSRAVSEGDIIRFDLTIRDLTWHGTWEWHPID